MADSVELLICARVFCLYHNHTIHSLVFDYLLLWSEDNESQQCSLEYLNTIFN